MIKFLPLKVKYLVTCCIQFCLFVSGVTFGAAVGLNIILTCQFCTTLQVRDKIIVKYIKKKLVLAVNKLFPIFLCSTVTFNS